MLCFLKLMIFQKTMISIAYKKNQEPNTIQNKAIHKLFKKIKILTQTVTKKKKINLLTKKMQISSVMTLLRISLKTIN